MERSLTILHMFPDLLNLYGDKGNIECMRKRLNWRGIGADVIRCTYEQQFTDFDKVDVIFLGMSVHKSEQTRFSKIVNAKITVITQQEETINIRIDNDIIQKEIEQTQQKLKSAPRV